VLFDTGHDDDGESWAGGRLARVLNDTQVEGNVVVARWYGGQNIGPVRFTHIENCAKEAIWKWKVATAEAEKEITAKKQRVQDEASKKDLAEELRQRDHSISALRKLLADKKAKLIGEEAAPPTPQKVMDYEKMGLDVLKRLDKARDATIAVILKQINKVDEELKLADELDDDALDELEKQDAPKEVQQKEVQQKEDSSTVEALRKEIEMTRKELDEVRKSNEILKEEIRSKEQNLDDKKEQERS
jgi:hypothetical protein